LGSTQIEATAVGYTAAVVMPVETIAPTVVFNSLDGARTTSSLRDDFSVHLQVPGAYHSTGFSSTSALTVALSLVEQEPVGVVNGIYSAATAGSLITQLSIVQGRNYSPSAYVAQPAAAGTYRVAAEIAGLATGQSAVQTVSAANQALKLSTYANSG
ncbi:hypothetical protein, partial [Lampropedia puyangensis]|uniref:hypothetical protein n=1 Tax=Lampropedia puyangensis TaxID=1330072 RepID=UPI0013052D7E